MTTEYLYKTVSQFREGILGGQPSNRMCRAVCLALAGYLSWARVIDAEIVEGVITQGLSFYQHYWLALPDGRIIDPTADQFTAPTGEKMPEVYIGELPEWYKVIGMAAPDETGREG